MFRAAVVAALLVTLLGRSAYAAVEQRDAAATPREAVAVDTVADTRGFVFYPSTPPAGAFGWALGASYDAIDPQVMYGVSLRVPELTLDAHRSLGKGFALKGHLDTMLVTTELLLGIGYAVRARPWAFEVSFSSGIYIGRLGVLGFDTWFFAPEYRPELTAGYDFGKLAVSLRASLLLMGPERAKVGEVWGGLDNSNAFVGHSEMVTVENTTRSGSAWYFGAGLLTTRAYYALWVLFPDSPALYSYPRLVVGYER